MHRSSFICLSFIFLAACTQPAVVVDNRGAHDFSNGSSGSQTTAAAPVISVEQAAPISHHNAPTEVATISNSSVMVVDLAPAAGTTEPAPVNQWTNTPREEKMTAEIPKSAPAKGPYIWPVDSRDVISGFGSKGAGKVSDGINIAAKKGEPVWAAADGEIIYAGSKLKGYGNMVIVKHTAGKTTSYAHLARMGVEKYDRVKQGDIIGYVGSTGSVKEPQLYFSVRDGSKPVDPQKYLGNTIAGL